MIDPTSPNSKPSPRRVRRVSNDLTGSELKFSYSGDIDGWKRYRC